MNRGRPAGAGSIARAIALPVTMLIVVVGDLSACGGKASTSQPGSGGATADGSVDQLDAGTGGTATGGVGSGGTAGGTATGGRATGGVSGGGGAGGRGGAGSVRSCPGYIPPSGTPCRSTADCLAGFCTLNPGPPGCGFQSQPMRLCNTDADCTNGFCLPAKTKAPCATGPDIVCVARCTATSCAAGERCGTDGHCQIFPCAEGFACPSGWVCAPERTGVDPNGCATASCATDGWTCGAPHTHCEPSAKKGVDLHGCAPDTCDTGAFTCGANQACGAPGDVNGCHCTSDAACPMNSHCDGTLGVCLTMACTTDTDCDCGACINKICQPGLWACQLQAA